MATKIWREWCNRIENRLIFDEFRARSWFQTPPLTSWVSSCIRCQLMALSCYIGCQRLEKNRKSTNSWLCLAVEELEVGQFCLDLIVGLKKKKKKNFFFFAVSIGHVLWCVCVWVGGWLCGGGVVEVVTIASGKLL